MSTIYKLGNIMISKWLIHKRFDLIIGVDNNNEFNKKQLEAIQLSTGHYSWQHSTWNVCILVISRLDIKFNMSLGDTVKTVFTSSFYVLGS